MTLRVLLVDDHPVVRSGLAALLATAPGVDVVGEAADGLQAVAEAVLLRPDVVVMDLALPGVDGVEATRRLQRAAPEVAVLVLTMSEDEESLVAAVRAGARGYVVKGAAPVEVVAAVQAVGRGEAVFGSGVAAAVTRRLGGEARQPAPLPFPELSARERQVLELVARGLPNPVIARQLGVTGKTVRNHISTVLAKTGCRDRTEAVLRAREAGLGKD